jgi:hypothetical protein
MDHVSWTPFERRVITTALAAAPLMAVIATAAMIVSPHEFAESDTATGWGLWLGAVLGLAMVLVLYVLPQLLFGLALRSATYGRVTAVAIVSPLLAFFGLQPLIAALIGGWAGVAPLAVVTAAAGGVLDCFVFIVALRGRRRLQRPNRAAIHHP